MGKQAKLRKKRRQGERKPVGAPAPGYRPDPLEDLKQQRRRPYKSQEEFDADCELAKNAWAKHYPVDELSEDFIAPLIEHDRAGPRPSEWVGTFRALMLEKYGSPDETDPRARYVLKEIAESYLDHTWETLGLATDFFE